MPDAYVQAEKWVKGLSKTKGAALVIPQLPRWAQERGVVKLPHTPEQGFGWSRYRQVCAAPVLPFAATIKPLRRAGSAAPDVSWGVVLQTSADINVSPSQAHILRLDPGPDLPAPSSRHPYDSEHRSAGAPSVALVSPV